MITTSDQPRFSETAIRQFLLGRMRGSKRVAFERALFCDASLEPRTRLEEMALADDYATRRLRENLDAFREKFACSSARRNQIDVSIALRECLAPAASGGRDEAWLTLKRPVWKLAFATMILMMLFATVWVATKEPRFVRRFVPHRTRHAAASTTPEVAHHAEHSSEPTIHREVSPAAPSHEAAGSALELNSTTTKENAPIVTLTTAGDKDIHVQLMLAESSPSTYRAELTTTVGEVVYTAEGLATDVGENRVIFDIPIECLTRADFQIKLTRTADGKQTVYFLRIN